MTDMTREVQAFIGLGSNLQTPLQQVTDAITELDKSSGIQVLQVSRWYRSRALMSDEQRAVGQSAEQQPDFINGVALVRTNLDAHALLDQLQAIENIHNRERHIRWDARTLDLDLLLYGNETINSERLQVPHPGIAERNFVLYPLADIKADLTLPIGIPLASLLARSTTDGLEPIAD
jgi:2-amino-4-hydroxy-6-hydroxymethyldihydropteridine diphosphokinase